MLKRLGGFKANAKLPPLFIPALPCSKGSHEYCNGWFIPFTKGQKSCLHCLGDIANVFPPKTTREDVIGDIIVTWEKDPNWMKIYIILLDNQKEHNKYTKEW